MAKTDALFPLLLDRRANKPADYARLRSSIRFAHVAALVLVLVSGCRRSEDSESAAATKVTLYCSVDEAFARDLLRRFEEKTGIAVAVTMDSEAGKTTGLVNKIIAEAQAGRARADVLFSSEVFQTIRLARMGLLEPYEPSTASDIPDRFKDPKHRWTALAVRARVIAYDPRKTSVDSLPKSWEELAESRFAEHAVMANPLFGTTRGHVAAMFALWGAERGRAYLTDLRANGVTLADGNSSAVRAVIAGRSSLACTDTDDVWVARRRGKSVDLIYPDMGDGGTLLVPSSVALIAGRPGSDAARTLVDFLVSAEVERMLATSDSRNIPVRSKLRAELGLEWPPASKIGYEAIADAMDEAISAVRDILLK